MRRLLDTFREHTTPLQTPWPAPYTGWTRLGHCQTNDVCLPINLTRYIKLASSLKVMIFWNQHFLPPSAMPTDRTLCFYQDHIHSMSETFVRMPLICLQMRFMLGVDTTVSAATCGRDLFGVTVNPPNIDCRYRIIRNAWWRTPHPCTLQQFIHKGIAISVPFWKTCVQRSCNFSPSSSSIQN
jgi:hypothetical protein